jgi:sulfate adenylyltransferase subunit 2
VNIYDFATAHIEPLEGRAPGRGNFATNSSSFGSTSAKLPNARTSRTRYARRWLLREWKWEVGSEMIAYRDKLAAEWNLNLIYGENRQALDEKARFNTAKRTYERDSNTEPFTGVIAGVADEEGSRSKERYFSPRNSGNTWEVTDQPPEFWNQYKTDFAHGTIHPLLDWTELNIWEYIEREKIPTVSLYYNQGDCKRYRSLGCYPCTNPVQSDARTVREIIEELRTGKFANIAERSGRAQDSEDEGGLESLRRNGYM